MAVSYWDGKQWIDLASGQQGPPGPAGNGISSVVMNADYTLTINFTNGSSYTTPSIRGAQGEQGEEGPAGVGITSVALISGTHAPGTQDTYRITFTDGDTYDFYVYNGADGQGSPGSQTPTHLGTGSAGSAAAYAREDHVHPGFVELWTNPNPASNFSAQAVPLDLSSWSFIAIVTRFSTTHNYKTMHFIRVGDTCPMDTGNLYSTMYTAKRSAAVSGTGVTFSTGYRNTTGTTGTDYCVPVAIYGVC